jgi:hypothetical protein
MEKNFNKLLLTALLIGAVGSAIAGTPCGTNLEYELDGTTLVLTSPDPTQAATINSQAFMGRMDFTDVVIPDNVTEINTRAFKNCTALTSVVIPPSVTLVGEQAFYDCSALVSVLCRPTSAPTLVADAFTGCHASLQICVPKLGGTDGYNSSDWNTSYGEKLNLCFLDERDDEETTAGQISAFRTQSTPAVFLFRTLRKAGCFNTLTLPFNVPNIATSPLAGAEVYEFVGATVVDNALQLDITLLAGSSLTAGTPYLIQWPNTGEVLNAMLFMDISWDVDQMADDAGAGQVTYHGFYGRTHIDDATNGTQHLNLFLGGNNTLYWPTDGDIASAKMLGFRAWFQVSTVASFAPVHRNMPASFRIVSTPTDMDQITNDQLPKTNKIIEDGHLIIIRNGEKYSINGQKL